MLCDLFMNGVENVGRLGLLELPLIGDALVSLIELIADLLNCDL